MRLVTRKIYRAFPELDRFSDEQCEQFVQAARGGRFAHVARGIAIIVVTLGLTLVIPTVALSVCLKVFGPSVVTPKVAQDQATSVRFAAYAMFVISPFWVLLFREVLLRFCIRRILRASVTCTQCDYCLLGVPFDASNVVACPECGRRTTVDPSLAALVATNASLARRSIGDHLVQLWIIPARARRVMRRALPVTFIVLVVLPGLVLGCWEYFIRRQAADARAARSTFAEAEAIVKAVGRCDPQGQSTRLDEFAKRFAERLNAINAVTVEELVTLPTGKQSRATARWRSLSLTHSSRASDSDAVALDQANRRLESAWLAAARSSGLFDLIDELARSPRLELAVSHDVSKFGVAGFLAPPLYDPCELAHANAAVAFETKSDADLVTAAERTFALARATRLQSALPLCSVIRVMQAQTLDWVLVALRERPDDSFADAVEAMLTRQWRAIPPDVEFEHARLSVRNGVASFFSDPGMARVGGASGMFRSGYLRISSGSRVPLWVGTLESNLASVDALFRVAATRQSFEPFERDSRPGASFDLSTMGPIGRVEMGWMLSGPSAIVTVSGESPQDRLELRRRFVTVAAALARHHVATGRYPASLAELGPLLPQIPADPWSGEPLLYRAQGDSYTLYSVGVDGVDNGGVFAPPQNGQPVAVRDIVAGQDE